MVAIIAPERLVRDVAPDLTGHSEAVFNESRTHRYLLVRRWMPGRRLTFLMLNPSTAGATEDDPTLRRCAGFARREGYAAVALVNLFALIAVSPRDLRCHPDPVGPRNDEFIRGHCRPGWTVVAAWGAHGALSRRAAVVTADLLARGVNLCCLGTTKAGEPRHPLYLPAATPLMPFRAPAGSDPAGTRSGPPAATSDCLTPREEDEMTEAQETAEAQQGDGEAEKAADVKDDDGTESADSAED